MKDESAALLIIEFAETISRYVFIIDCNLEESLVYEIMYCPYPSIQKSCYILLKFFYENFAPF